MSREHRPDGGHSDSHSELRRLARDVADAFRDVIAEQDWLRHVERAKARASLGMSLGRRIMRGDFADLSVKRTLSAYDHLLSVN
jgi:hypothetical protein